MKKDNEPCGCCGPNRGMQHLIDMLERQQKPINQAEIETADYPASTSGASRERPEPDSRPTQGQGGCA